MENSLYLLITMLVTMSPIQKPRQECIVYSRVVGWLTPVRNYNPGKASEYKDRKTFKVNVEAN